MKLENIKYICELPRAFHSTSKSYHELITPYKDLNISIHDLSSYLKKNPNLIVSWLRYSEDKRCPSGYYFIKGIFFYQVGKLLETGKTIKKKNFINAHKACANFILNEISEMLNN